MNEWTGIEIKKALKRTKEINKELKTDLINDCKEQNLKGYSSLKVNELREKLINKLYEELRLSKDEITFVTSKPTDSKVEAYIDKKKNNELPKKMDADLELFKFLRGRKS